MADESHLSVLKQGVEAWNPWGRAHPLDQAILIWGGPESCEPERGGPALGELERRLHGSESSTYA